MKNILLHAMTLRRTLNLPVLMRKNKVAEHYKTLRLLPIFSSDEIAGRLGEEHADRTGRLVE